MGLSSSREFDDRAVRNAFPWASSRHVSFDIVKPSVLMRVADNSLGV